MTCKEIIAELEVHARAHGLEIADKSDSRTLRIEYHAGGKYVGGASYIGIAEHPEWMTNRDMEYAKLQIEGLAAKNRKITDKQWTRKN